MRRYFITPLICLLACLIVTHSTFGQGEDDRWQRVYSGDDATIDILPSSLRLEPDHVLTVTFRTAMSSSQPLKKEKPGVKYKTVVETIDFNPISRQYRYKEIRWLDTGGTEIDSFKPATPPEWRAIRPGGMVDRMFDMAGGATPFGTWRVLDHRFGKGGDQSPSVRSAAAKLLGTLVRLSPRKAEFGPSLCESPDYESKNLTADDLGKQLGIQVRSIGIKSDQVEIVNVKCLSDGWKPPQSLLIKLPEGGLLMLWDGIFLELGKTDSFGKPLKRNAHAQSTKTDSSFVVEQGAIIRGDKSKRRLALVFTGDEFADGADTIIQTLKRHNTKASFFFTGTFYRNPAFKAAIQSLRSDGHYLGAHSNDHLLYCDWTNRNQLLITKETFAADLKKNYEAMAEFGISKQDARLFLPPFEWYNQTISDWSSAIGLRLINFTPGTRSNADYTTPSMKNYVGTETILQSIKDYEAKDPASLNGFILLMHVGTDPERTDKLYAQLDKLIDWLKGKKYELVRIDELLAKQEQ